MPLAVFSFPQLQLSGALTTLVVGAPCPANARHQRVRAAPSSRRAVLMSTLVAAAAILSGPDPSPAEGNQARVFALQEVSQMYLPCSSSFPYESC